MKTYTDAQLDLMKNADPDRYFYYSREEMFRRVGINLENEDWDLPLVYDYSSDQMDGKFARFVKIMNSKNGVTLVNHSGDLIRIKAPEFKEEILALSDDNAKKIGSKDLKPEPKGLGIGFYILLVLSFGFYGNERLKTYKDEMREYKAAKADFIKREEERKEAFKGYEATLELMGKSPSNVKNYMRDDKIRLNEEEINNKKLNGFVTSIETLFERRAIGYANLDYVMGQKAENAEKVKEILLKNHYLGKNAFERSNVPGERENYLLHVDFPKDTKFSEHEIALFGLAATCCFDVQKASNQYPVPGEKAVMDDAEAEKITVLMGATWYNFTEAIFNRQERNAAAAVPLFNHAKLAVCEALNKSKDGDYSELGEIIKNGLRYCTREVMGTSAVRDVSTWVDYCVYAKEMLAMADRNSELKNAIIDSGFTEQDIRDAIICSNIGDVYERGLNAFNTLSNNSGLTSEEKANAAAEIVELRVIQQMLINHDKELHGDEYTNTQMALVVKQGELMKAKKKAEEEHGTDSEEYKKCDRECNEVGFELGNLPHGFMAEHFNLKINFGEILERTFGSVGSVDRFHDYVKGCVDFEKFKSMDTRNIITELISDNVKSYVSQVYPQKEVKKEKNLENNKKELQNVKGNAMNV